MKRKVSELEGAALDWAVAKAEGYIDSYNSWLHEATVADVRDSGGYHPSVWWSSAGPIIERERISVNFDDGGIPDWYGFYPNGSSETYGPTPLVAAMRCYVASKLGNEIDVPDELA